VQASCDPVTAFSLVIGFGRSAELVNERMAHREPAPLIFIAVTIKHSGMDWTLFMFVRDSETSSE